MHEAETIACQLATMQQLRGSNEMTDDEEQIDQISLSLSLPLHYYVFARSCSSFCASSHAPIIHMHVSSIYISGAGSLGVCCI